MKFLLVLSLLITLLAPVTSLKARAVSPPERWRSIRTNNLFLVGNAEEEELRQAAIWLEFFHSSFARLISRTVVDPTVPTTVIVFKNDAAFIPFKPLYQGRPANVAGYFQPGRDVNYIAMSLERRGRNPLSTAFHEYVHLHLMNNFPGTPLWLNEGVAEFYGSIVGDDGNAILGNPQLHYLRLLRAQGVLPLNTLFAIDHSSPHYNEQDKSGVFYAQSWALVHYLMMGDGGKRGQQFRRFLSLASQGESMEKALQNAFGLNVAAIERGFVEYLRNGDVPSERLDVGNGGPQSSIAMQRTSVSEAEANFYLGDLLAHIHRDETAEKYFKQAIALDSSFIPSYASLGLLCMRQNRLAEARKHLERAASTPQSYLVHYFYAYLLSRDGLTEGGNVRESSASTAQTMRDQLGRVIKVAPEFADAYYLLAWVNVATSASSEQKLEESLGLVKRAQRLAPERLGYGLLLAEIYRLRGEKELARQVLDPLTRQNSNAGLRDDAQDLLDSLEGKTVSSTTRRSSNVSASALPGLSLPQSSVSGSMLGGAGGGPSIRDGRTIDRSGSIPSVDEVFARFADAVGESKLLSVINSRTAKGSIDVIGISRGGSFEIYAKAPGKTLTVTRTPTFGESKLGFNGRAKWTQFASRNPRLGAAELGGLEWIARVSNPASLKMHYSKIALLGKSNIGFREVYLVELQSVTGPAEQLYLDVSTHLPVRVNASGLEIYFDDWRELDGVKCPFSITQSSSGLTLKVTLQEVKHNVAVDDALFEKPVR
jgi:tetratricopeptide (TPR) repeat protein